ncbi:hypothetical protein T06_7975 [Trichinella sp. T6]|nr:hypothetical protein T06_7975 [Trichinella sp. T6]
MLYEPLGFCTLEMLKYNFARRSLVGQNESGLYNVGFLGQPNTGLSRSRGTHSVDRSERRVNIERYKLTVQEIDSYSTAGSSANCDDFTEYFSSRRSLVARYIELGSAAQAGSSFGPPMSSPLTAGELAIYGADLNYRRSPIKLL